MILVIGATGLLGQEIVIQALEAGYEVKCLVRNINKSTNLRRFGAQLVYGDLSLPETIPRNLKGIKILIDASTLRLNATYHSEKLDWYGKLVLLKSAKIYKINRFIYFSVANVEYNPHIHLMKLKFQFEKVLIKSNVSYTIFRISNFLQSFISEYSRRILNENSIWITKAEESKSYSYIDVYNVAKICLESFYFVNVTNSCLTLTDKTLTLQTEFENLCKTVVGPLAEVLKIPTFLLNIGNNLSKVLEATWNIQDRFNYFESLNNFNSKPPYSIYLNKLFRTNLGTFYSYPNYLRDYLDLVLLDLQKLHKSSL